MSTEGRRDRTGEPVPHDFHDPDTCTGWLGETDEGALIPCLLCRPHLRRSEIERRLPRHHNPRRTHDHPT